MRKRLLLCALAALTLTGCADVGTSVTDEECISEPSGITYIDRLSNEPTLFPAAEDIRAEDIFSPAVSTMKFAEFEELTEHDISYLCKPQSEYCTALTLEVAGYFGEYVYFKRMEVNYPEGGERSFTCSIIKYDTSQNKEKYRLEQTFSADPNWNVRGVNDKYALFYADDVQLPDGKTIEERSLIAYYFTYDEFQVLPDCIPDTPLIVFDMDMADYTGVDENGDKVGVYRYYLDSGKRTLYFPGCENNEVRVSNKPRDVFNENTYIAHLWTLKGAEVDSTAIVKPSRYEVISQTMEGAEFFTRDTYNLCFTLPAPEYTVVMYDGCDGSLDHNEPLERALTIRSGITAEDICITRSNMMAVKCSDNGQVIPPLLCDYIGGNMYLLDGISGDYQLYADEYRLYITERSDGGMRLYSIRTAEEESAPLCEDVEFPQIDWIPKLQ